MVEGLKRSEPQKPHIRKSTVQIVAARVDFAERGSMSRSTLRATDALDL
jgi:hypothetical protein